MVLAAGFGTRLSAITRHTPKPLIKVHDRYLISYVFQALRAGGVTDVVVNLHHLGSQIKLALGDGKRFGVNIKYSEEPQILGTGGGVKNAESLIGRSTFVLINGDIICDIDLKKAIEFHRLHQAHATMVVREDRTVKNFDEIKLDRQFNILSINKRPVLASERFIPRMFTGIHILEPIVFEFLRPEFSSIIANFYQPAIEQQLKITAYDFDGFWCDAGTKESLQRIRKEPLGKILTKMPVL